MTSIRSFVHCGLVALSLACMTAAGCGNDLSSVLVQVSSIPPNTVRLNAAVSASGKSATVIFERDSSNRFVVSSAMLMPPMAMAPSSVQLAFDLPAGTTGNVVIRFTVETAEMPMTGGPPPTASLSAEGCGRVELVAPSLYNLPITLRAIPNPCPY